MKKIYTLLTAMAFSGLAASAGELPLGTVIDDYGRPLNVIKLTEVYNFILEWDETLTFVEGFTPYFTIQKEGEEAVTYSNGDYDTYYPPVSLGYYYYDSQTSSNAISLYFPTIKTLGSYTLTIPAGMVEDINGDKNVSQSINFSIVGVLSDDNDSFNITPPQSVSVNNGPVPFYSASELSAITISWEGVTLSEGSGKITAYNEDYIDAPDDAFDNTKFEDGKLVLDLSSWEPGAWTIYLPKGFADGVDESGNEYITNYIYLSYVINNPTATLDDVEMTYPRSFYLNELESATFSFGQPIKLTGNGEVTLTKGSSNYEVEAAINSRNGNYSLEITLESAIDTYGDYTLTIPAGYISNGGNTNDEIVKVFHVLPAMTNYSPSLEDHTTVSEVDFAKLKVTFPQASTIEPLTANWKNISVWEINYGVSRNEVSLSYGNGVTVNGNSIEISIPNIKQYQYDITIPAFDFIMDGEYTNDQINLYYTVWDGMADPIIIQGPNENTTSNVVIELTWNYQTITPTADFNVILDGGYDTYPVPSDCYEFIHIENENGDAQAGNNALRFDLSSAIESAREQGSSSNFTFIIPAGIVENVGGLVNPRTQFEFKVYPVVDSEAIFEETETPELYSLHWEGQTWISTPYCLPVYETETSTISLEYQELEYSDPLSVLKPGCFGKLYSDALGYSNYYFNLKDMVNEEERSVLVIPQGFVAININYDWTDLLNEEMTFVITEGKTSAIDKLNNNNDGILRVYNLQGVNVMNASDSSALKSLAPGIYIINGKKVALRK